MNYYMRKGPIGLAESDEVSPVTKGVSVGYRIGAAVATPLLVYHGYKRNESIGWAVVWGLIGGGFWVFGVPLAFAQGYAKRKVRPNARRRRTSRRTR